jgi:undecaprenyl-diphosphatase
LAIGLPGLVVTIGKRLIGRVRPSDFGPFAFEPWSWKAAHASLPSGHATTAFAAAVAVSLLWPRARLFIWTFAVMIAASRVAVTAHYPSDVLAGAGAGIFGALIVRNWFAQRRLGFFVDPNGKVRAMPGPSLHRIKTLARRVLGY